MWKRLLALVVLVSLAWGLWWLFLRSPERQILAAQEKFLAALGDGRAVRAAWQALPGEDWTARFAEAAAAALENWKDIVTAPRAIRSRLAQFEVANQ